MPNGIQIRTVDEFERLKPEERQTAIFEALVRIESHCKCRKEECNKKYVTKKQAKIVAVVTGAFMLGFTGFKIWPIMVKLIHLL